MSGAGRKARTMSGVCSEPVIKLEDGEKTLVVKVRGKVEIVKFYRIRPDTPFRKIRDAFCHDLPPPGNLHFFNGEHMIRDEETPLMLQMKNGAEILAVRCASRCC